MTALSESMRQEFCGRHLRVGVVEPGAVATELISHVREEVVGALQSRLEGVERLRSEDIADAIAYVVTRPRHVAINEVLVRPTEQAG